MLHFTCFVLLFVISSQSPSEKYSLTDKDTKRKLKSFLANKNLRFVAANNNSNSSNIRSNYSKLLY